MALIIGHRRKGNTAASIGWIGGAPSSVSGQSKGRVTGSILEVNRVSVSCSPGARTRVFLGDGLLGSRVAGFPLLPDVRALL